MKIESQGSLLQIARDAIACYLEGGIPSKLQGLDPELLQKSGAFVTLHKGGQLRGCVGQIVSDLRFLGRSPNFQSGITHLKAALLTFIALVDPFSACIELRGLLKLIAIIGDGSAGDFCIVFPFKEVCKFSVAVRLFTLT